LVELERCGNKTPARFMSGFEARSYIFVATKIARGGLRKSFLTKKLYL
jgi:hypothetical protein